MAKPGDDNIRGGVSDAVISTKGPCPECGKAKLTVYADGHTHCFNPSCNHHTAGLPEFREVMPAADLKAPVTKAGLIKPPENAWQAITKLRLNAATTKRFGYFQGPFGGRTVQIAPLYDQKGNLVAQEVRLPNEQYRVITPDGEPSGDPMALWGVHVYGDNRDRKVVLNATKISAMSVAQVTNLKVPSVAPAHGSVVDAAKANYRWLDRFQEVILYLPDTEQGKQDTQTIAAMFPVGKVKIAKVEGAVDASDALVQGRPGDIDAAMWSAVVWRPAGIINAMDGLDAMFDEGLQTPSWPYPWPEFNEKTKGMRPGEVSYHVGGTGIAKTTLMFHMAEKGLTWDGKPFLEDYPCQEPCKQGWLGFEDMTKQVRLGILGVHMGKVLAIDGAVDVEKVKKAALKLYGSRRLELFDPEQAEYGLEAIKGYVRYMVRALGCRVLYVDPLTAIVDLLPAANRTQEEDQIASWFAQEAKASNACFHIGYHLKKPDGKPFEEGRHIGINDIKGSGALTRYAHNVYAYRRNQQGDRPDLLEASSLKGRVSRYTGPIAVLKYDMATGVYTVTDEAFPDDDDSGDNKTSPRKGFGPAPSGKDY